MAIACKHKTEEARHLESLVCAAACIGQIVVHQTNAVACLQPHAGRNHGVISVIVTPVWHVRHTCAKAALIKAVCVFLCVKRCLTVLRSHDYLKEELHHELSHKPVCLPALAAFAGVCAEVRCADVRCRHAQHGELCSVLRRCFGVAGRFQCRAVAATETLSVANHAAKYLVCSVHNARTNPACAACGYADAYTIANGSIECDALHQRTALMEYIGDEAVPAPHALPLRTVEGGGAAVVILCGVRRVELALLAVVRHEVAAKSQLCGQVTQCLKAAVVACRRRCGV